MLRAMPPILTERTVWKRPRPANASRTPDLTPEEIANVKRALRVLRERVGGYQQLAAALGANRRTVQAALETRTKLSVGLALRAARLAGVRLEEVLSGAWPKAGACPHCGRT